MADINFNFYLGSKVIFGRGTSAQLCTCVRQLGGHQVFVVADPFLSKNGHLSGILDGLQQDAIPFTIFDQIEPNPRTETADRGTEAFTASKSDIIVAVGGGSTIDVAKAVSACAANHAVCYDLLDGRGSEKKNVEKIYPFIALPTTSGTGSEVSMYSVITDDQDVKDSITSEKIYPTISIVDPELMMSLPAGVTVNTGLDVFGHALEAFTSTIDNPMCDAWAIAAIVKVMKYLPIAVNEGTVESREQMAIACMMAGNAMSQCAATLPHALGCALGGNLGIAHGKTVGILQIPMIDFDREVCGDRFCEVVHAIDRSSTCTAENAADELIAMLRNLFAKIGFQEKLNMQVDEAVLSKMVHDASIHGCLKLNRREISNEQIKNMFLQIL